MNSVITVVTSVMRTTSIERSMPISDVVIAKGMYVQQAMEKYSSARATTSASPAPITRWMIGSGISRASATKISETSAQNHSTTEKIRRMRAMSFLPQYCEISTEEPLTRPVSVAV